MNATSLINILWASAAILQIALCYACMKSGLGDKRPAFSAFVYFENGLCALVVVASFVSPMAYFWMYYLSFGVTTALVLLVAIECGKFTFGPRMALPSWVPVRIASMVASAVALAIAFDLMFATVNGGRLTRAMVTTELCFTFLSLALFLIVMTYSGKLGISGQPHTQKIMRGFVLYLLINVAAVYVRGSARPGAAMIAKALGMAGYCVSLVYWTVALWAKEEMLAPLTAQQTQDLNTAFRRLRERAESLSAVSVR